MSERAAADATLGRADEAPLEAMPVEKVPVNGLRRLLASQRDEWLATLDWDFAPVADLIADAIAHDVLRGVALVAGHEPVAFAVYTVEARRCVIGEVFVKPPYRTDRIGRMLVEALVDLLPDARARRRVESQSLVFETEGMSEAFAVAGFARTSRFYMVADAGAERGEPGLRSSGRIALRSWLDNDFDRIVEVIYVSYRGTEDARINGSYRTRDGCADLLDALTDSVWCGRFDPAITQVAVDTETGRAVGVAVASRISATAAHLGQVSVLPAYQGRGVGRALVKGAIAGARLAGLERVTLAVTAANERAMHLYTSCGFAVRTEFPVYSRG